MAGSRRLWIWVIIAILLVGNGALAYFLVSSKDETDSVARELEREVAKREELQVAHDTTTKEAEKFIKDNAELDKQVTRLREEIDNVKPVSVSHKETNPLNIQLREMYLDLQEELDLEKRKPGEVVFKEVPIKCPDCVELLEKAEYRFIEEEARLKSDLGNYFAVGEITLQGRASEGKPWRTLLKAPWEVSLTHFAVVPEKKHGSDLRVRLGITSAVGLDAGASFCKSNRRWCPYVGLQYDFDASSASCSVATPTLDYPPYQGCTVSTNFEQWRAYGGLEISFRRF